MAQATATTLSDFSGFLTPAVSQAYFEAARKQSSVQQLARQVPLGINGQAVPVSTGKAAAAWVAEGTQKPASESALTIKPMQPKKIAAISVVSAEVVRANPGNFMEILKADIAEAFAIAFDQAVLAGTSTPFGAYVGQSTKTQALGPASSTDGGVYGDLVAGMQTLVADGKKLTGFALDRLAEPILLSGTDTVGRPLFIDTPLADTTSAVTPGRLLGRPSFIGDNIKDGDTVAYGGDWSQVIWGVVGGISYSVSTEAAVTLGGTLVSLFENNLVAILAEAEYGCLVNDPQAFVKYTYDAAAVQADEGGRATTASVNLGKK